MMNFVYDSNDDSRTKIIFFLYNLKEEKDEEIVVSLDEDNGDNGYKWISKSEGTKLEQQKKEEN